MDTAHHMPRPRETLLPSGGGARYTTGSGERSLVAVSGHRQR